MCGVISHGNISLSGLPSSINSSFHLLSPTHLSYLLHISVYIWLCLMHVHIINIESTILKKSVNFNSCVSLSPVALAGCGERAPGDHVSGL